jgi:hypothetical protein
MTCLNPERDMKRSKDGARKRNGALTVLGTKENHDYRDFSTPETKRSPRDLGTFFWGLDEIFSKTKSYQIG